MINPSPSFTIALFAFLVFILVCILLAKKFYYRFAKKKRYFIVPRVGTTGMMNVAMVIAIAVSLIILIMSVTGGVASIVFRAYPGTRVTIEIILIKIAGLLFGPIIGMISGALIDVLAIALSAGFFHYGYFLSAILTGLISGVLRSMTALPKLSKRRDLWIAIYASVFMVAATAITVGFIASLDLSSNSTAAAIAGNDPVSTEPEFSFNLKGTTINFKIGLVHYLMCLVAFSILIIAIIWVMFSMQILRNRKNATVLTNFSYRTHQHINHKGQFWRIAHKNAYLAIVNTLALAGAATLVINIVFIPVYDADITTQPYEFWLLFRSLAAIFLFIIDIVVIYPVLLVIMPIMKYNYEDELIEDLRMPLHYETWGTKEDATTNAAEIAIKACSETLLFKLNEAQMQALRTEFNELLDQFERVAAIDTEGVKPTHYPISISPHKLRLDVPTSADRVVNVAQTAEQTAQGLVRVY